MYFHISLALVILHCTMIATGQNITDISCSCYTFNTVKKPWKSCQEDCTRNGGGLVSMETEEEWAFINIQIQKRYHTEWYTSLRKVDGDWLWPNNQSFTIDKWQPMEPNGDGSCAVMAKKWPWEERGLFNDIFCAVGRESICEYSHENPTCNSSKLLWCNKALGDDSPQQLETVGPSISPIENKTVTKGEPILLLCNATGDPAPNVSWSKASGTINPSYVSGKELWILSAKLSDAGKYICTAKNDVSMTTVEAFVTVMLRPHSPVPLSTQITHLTINVYWKKPKSHGYPVLMYSVHRVELDQAGQEVKSRTYHVNEDVHHYEAGDIERGKTYKFYVTAWNTHGESVKDHRKSVTVKVQKP